MEKIEKFLPQRPPFLFVDEIINLEKGKSCVAIKRVKEDEFWVNSHFPNFPIMPGVLLIEALAQASILIFQIENFEDQAPIFVKIESFTFKKPIFPLDTIILKSEVLLDRHNFIKFKVSATKNNEVAGEGVIIATFKRKEELIDLK